MRKLNTIGLFGLLLVTFSWQAQAGDWVEKSNEHAQIVLPVPDRGRSNKSRTTCDQR